MCSKGLFVGVFLVVLLSVAFSSSVTATRTVSVGVYPGGQDVAKYETQLNVKFDYVLVFQSIKQLNYSKVVKLLNRGYGVILNVEFTDTFANLKNITAGLYDRYLTSLCTAIKADGRQIWLRPLHEFNGNWYNWAAFYPGNNKADFTAAWKHVVRIFKNQNAPVKFQLNYNIHNFPSDGKSFWEFYPGDYWVDMVVATCYNRAGTDQWHLSFSQFKDLFAYPYSQMCALTSKPLGVAEMGSTDHYGNKTRWIINAFNSIKYNFPRVSQMTWFLLNKTVNGYSWDWDLNTSAERKAFTQGMLVVRSIR
jgi:endoglucanase